MSDIKRTTNKAEAPSSRDMRILYLRAAGLTLREIGGRCGGVTSETIRHLLARAERRLAHVFGEHKGSDEEYLAQWEPEWPTDLAMERAIGALCLFSNACEGLDAAGWPLRDGPEGA